MEPTDPRSFEDRLIAVQKAIKAPKDKENSFAKYKYRKAEDILEAAKPLLSENGLLLTISDHIAVVADRFYVVAEARITDGKRGVEVTAFAREQAEKKGLDEAQITGSASSYARKYALSGLFLLDDSEADPDTDEHHRQTHDAPQRPQNAPQRTEPSQQGNETNGATPHAQQPITPRQKQLLFALAGEIATAQGTAPDWVKDDLYAYFAVDSTTKLTTAQGAHAIRALQQTRAKGTPFADALARTKE